MRTAVLAVAVLASLSACGGGDQAPVSSSTVFKSMGRLQCSGGGVSLAALQAQLAAGNVEVRAATCGTDGLATPTVCGSPDGYIGIFEISSAQAGAAAAAGFMPLSTVPTAKTVFCP